MHISAYEPCLERVAEELMGRRKWKQYQESLMRTHLNSDQFVASIEDNNIELKKELDNFHSKNREFIDILPQAVATATTIENFNLEENHRKDSRNIPLKEQQQQQKAKEENEAVAEGEQVKNTTPHHIKLEADTFKDKTASQIANNTASLQIANNNNNNNITITLNNNNNNNNNNSITSTTIGASNEAKIHLETLSTPQTPTTPPPPEPIDWKPNEKCHFCINGKLLTVNAKGELVAESGPTGSETDHIQKLDCESDSNESISNAAVSTASVNTNGNLPLMTGAATLTDSNPTTLNKLLTQKMASMDSVAAQLAAIQSILPNLNWMSQQQQQQQQQQQSQPDSVIPTTSDTLAAAISPSLKDSPSPSDATGEQPLDLSSKPSPNSSISGDLKSIRIKSSRATLRTYKEEDMNCALQDILSGKLGTRKAAVQYNVPRSTLRNKIYKLTAEAKRNNEPAPPELLQLQQELEKEMSGDDDDVESNASTPQPEDAVVRLIPTPNILKKLCTNNGDGTDVGCDTAEEHVLLHRSPKPAHIESSKPQTCESTAVGDLTTTQTPQVPALDAALPLLLRTLLLSDKGIRDLFSALLSSNLKDLLLGPTSSGATTSSAATLNSSESLNSNLNNGNQQQPDYRSLLQLLLQQQQQQQQQPTSFATGRRLPKSDTPETNSSVDPNETCDDPAAILKIPSYTPVAGPSNSLGASSSRASPALLCHSNSNSNSNRNGSSPDQLLLAAAVQKQFSNKNLSVTPPLMHTRVDGSPSPQTMRISDVIASSIQRTMNEQANKEAASVSLLNFTGEAERNHALALGNDYKKPTISVVKNIGGTDTSRFGAAPNLLTAAQHHHHSAHLQHSHHPHLSRQEAAALAAGKGTRPKRGKYRNYDRDSLVEAVKAVQRGEMSVHRAGSYYGVPHSTLEYKVKERHLMRPRKREPKPQPGLDGSSSSSKTNANIPGNLSAKTLNSANNNLKLTSGTSIKNNNSSGTNAASFASNTANGMKLSLFESNLQHLPYSPQLFWPHNQAAFGQLQMDFNRNTTARSAASPTDNSSDILKNHMQRYQDSTTNSSNGPSPVSSPVLSGQDINRARELYESNAANGASFLDGIIRKSLDRKTNEVNAASTSASSGGGVLLDQLLMKKTPLPFTNSRNNEFNTSISPSPMATLKRSGSPMSLGSSSTIKRERCSPHSVGSDDDETSHSGLDESYENNNNNNNNNSKTGNGQGLKALGLSQTRSRVASRDSNSETDNSSMKSEIHMSNHHHHHHHPATGHPNNINNLMDINGGGGNGDGSSGGVTVKTEIPNHETTSTSILQEKLSQIKAEQQENEENL